MRTAKMLIVEDESVVAMDIQRGLTTLGYPRPELAASGTEALEKASELRPDLVLMDIRLHGDMDGIDAAEQIRANLGIPVVYLTAYADDKTVERATKTQPYGYILKPFRERELGTAIEVALYNHQMEKEFKQRIEREQDELKRRQTALERDGQAENGRAGKSPRQGQEGSGKRAAQNAPRLASEAYSYGGRSDQSSCWTFAKAGQGGTITLQRILRY